MKFFLGLVVIIATLVIAGRQPANATGKIILVFLFGFLAFSAVAQIPDADDNIAHDKDYYAQSSYYKDPSPRTSAISKEEADALRGTGYHNTRPGSVAEHNELQAAQVKCKECGYHSDNGYNSLCDSCWEKSR